MPSVPSLSLLPKLQMSLPNRLAESIWLWPRNSVRSSVRLWCDRLTDPLLSTALWSSGLQARVLRLTRPMSCLVMCCSNARRCVVSLCRLNGPSRQLLVLVRKLLMWLAIELCVARTSIGNLRLPRCSRRSSPRLLLLGRFRLSITILNLVIPSTVCVDDVAVMRLMAKFRVARLVMTLSVTSLLLL